MVYRMRSMEEYVDHFRHTPEERASLATFDTLMDMSRPGIEHISRQEAIERFKRLHQAPEIIGRLALANAAELPQEQPWIAR